MDRRDFLKTLISTPLVPSLLSASESTKTKLQLCLIADSPHLFLPSILQALNEQGLLSGQTFAHLNPHPAEEELNTTLALAGWRCVSKTARTDFTLSFSALHQKAAPSFTLIKKGKVWDLRSKKLFFLWEEMSSHHSPSSWLTTVSSKEKNPQLQPGSYASVFIHGQRVKTFGLKKNALLSFPAKKGEVSVAVNNGKICVVGSSCAHKICVLSPPVSSAGERIICAPNRFLLEVERSSFIDTVIG